MPVTSPSLMVKYPLHHIISDTTSTEQGTTRFIRAMFIADPECIRRPDELGMTPLSVAILRENAAAITALLELASPLMAQGQDPLGLQVPDRQHETAVMQNARLLRANKRFLIHDLLEGASKDITLAYIYNMLPVCSCGKCTEGWLSSKMRFRLRGKPFCHPRCQSMLMVSRNCTRRLHGHASETRPLRRRTVP